MHIRTLLTTLVLLSATHIFAEENLQIQQLADAVEQLKAQISSLQAQDDKQDLRKQLAQLTAQIQHFHLESIKHNDKGIASVQADLKSQIDEIKKELASNVRWENKAFAMLTQTLDVQKQPVLTAQNDQTLKTTPKKQEEPSDFFRYQEPMDFHGGSAWVDYLFWKVSQQACYFVITQNQQIPPADISANIVDTEGLGRFRSARLGWNSGFRVGLGYTTKHDAWKFFGEYTYYSTDGTKKYHRSADPNLYLFGTFTDISNAFITGSTEAESHSKFNYNIVDLLLSRRMMMSQQVLLNFFLGFTGAFMNEDWDVSYLSPVNNTYIENDWNFNGGGLRTGLDSNWHFGKGFGLVGKASFGAVLGRYHNHSEGEYLPPPATGSVPNLFRDASLRIGLG
jgi:hypothetical protein